MQVYSFLKYGGIRLYGKSVNGKINTEMKGRKIRGRRVKKIRSVTETGKVRQ